MRVGIHARVFTENQERAASRIAMGGSGRVDGLRRDIYRLKGKGRAGLRVDPEIVQCSTDRFRSGFDDVGNGAQAGANSDQLTSGEVKPDQAARRGEYPHNLLVGSS